MQISVFNHTRDLPEPMGQALSYRNGIGFFYSIEWFSCLIDHGISTTTTPRIYVAHHDEVAECVLFMATERGGSTLNSLTTFYTMEFAPLMVGENSAQGLQQIIAHIARESPKFSAVDLRFVRDGTAQRSLMIDTLEEHGFATHSFYQYDNWYLDVADRSFDDYYNSLNSRLKNTIRRKHNKAQRDHQLALYIYPTDALELEQVISDYNAIYSKSWKQDEPFPTFMAQLLKSCDELGILRAGHATVDGKAAAAQIWINDRDRTLIYKLAYNKKFVSMSIGSLLSKKLFEHAINHDKVTEIDYGVGNEPYKKDWMSGSRTLGGVLACNTGSLSGRLKHVRESLTRRFRKRS